MQAQAPGLDHVIAIGASAGGLDALQELIPLLPTQERATYVLAQHLAPAHTEPLTELLGRLTPLQVRTATSGSPLKPGELLVVPARHDARFCETGLELIDATERSRPSPSIDLLFDSLAQHWGGKGVAIVLSGTGSDGACGLRNVGAAGGLTLVQSPESARFDGMPRAAITLGRVDTVANPVELGQQLARWMVSDPLQSESKPRPTDQALLRPVIDQLQHNTGIDFSEYKESTLRRQIHRRMAIHGLKSMEDYLSILSSQTEESQHLAQNLLVTVTSFFRDSTAFTALRPHLERLIHRSPIERCLRVWVPGCATGEEAYSLCMILSELLGHPVSLQQKIKIFATDLDESSLTIARRGIYPASSAKDIPAPLLLRFSSSRGHEFEVQKDLRNCIVFARHNVSEDPPFPNIDLISCRNTLIYFTPPLQKRVLDLFGFSLKAGGILFLGSSESLGNANGFKTLNPIHRIYERTRESNRRDRGNPPTARQRSLPARKASPTTISISDTIPEQHIQILESLVRHVIAPCLVLDEDHNLVEVIGNVSPYCRIPEGMITTAAGAFLRQELQAEAKALLLLVRADRYRASSGTLSLADLEGLLRLEANPLPVGDRDFTVLSFIQEKPDSRSAEHRGAHSKRDAAFAQEIERLERELLSSQDSLRRSLADLERANEELEASSEELQASSEELQSSNEELEASNEELQATNEELGALNRHLRSRSSELERLNNDLENIQCSLSQGMVIVDQQLRVCRFSPLAVRVFGLVDSDIGQSLLGVPTTVALPGLRDALEAVVNGDQKRSIEASSEDIAYLVQIIPYLDRDAKHLGAIITLTDVSELVALRRAAEASLREFTSLANALEPVVWKRDHTMEQILYISDRVAELTGWSPQELRQNSNLLDAAIVAADQARVRACRDGQQGGWSISYGLISRSGREMVLQEQATVLDDSNDHCVVGTLTDTTAWHRWQRHALLVDAALDSLMQWSCLSQPCCAFALLDHQRTPVSLSRALSDWLQGPSPSEPLSSIEPLQEALQLCGPAAATGLLERIARVLQEGTPDTGLSLALPRGSADPELASANRLDILPMLDEQAGTLGVLLRLYRQTD